MLLNIISILLILVFSILLLLPLLRKKQDPQFSEQDITLLNEKPLHYLCRNDPILFGLAHVSSWWKRYILVIAFGYVPAFLFSWIEGNAFPRSGLKTPIITDIFAGLAWLFFIPIGLLLALHFFNSISQAVNLLSEKGVINIELQSYADKRVFKSCGISIAIFFPVSFSFILFKAKLISSTLFSSWYIQNGQYTFAGVYTLILQMLLFLTLGLTIHKFFYNLRFLIDLKEEKLNLQIYHPDGCGGLEHFGNICLAFNWIAFLVGIISAWFVIMRTIILGMPLYGYNNLIIMGLYTIWAPMGFFLPMRVVHKKMKDEKDKILYELSTKLNSMYKQIRLESLDGTGKKYTGGLKRFEKIEKLYKITETLPTWPFNVKMLRIFAGTWLFPILSTLFAQAIHLIFY